MDARPNDFDLGLKNLGLRFVSPEAETVYRVWRNEQNLPTYWLVAFVSIFAWGTAPITGFFLLPQFDWFGAWRVGYVLVIPMMLALMAAYHFSAWYRSRATLAAAIMLVITGCAMFSVFTIELAAVLHEQLAAATVAVMMLMASFALFSRLPPLLATLSVVPCMLPTAALVIQQFQSGMLNPAATYGGLNMVGVTWFFVSVMSAASERYIRNAFITEQLLVRQKAALESSQKLIRRYVPSALAEQIIGGKTDGIESPQRRRVTVLFSDIVGFTETADRVEPEVMTQIISEYMAAMAGIVDAHKGTVNEFIGDGLMALFGAPTPLPPEDQARNAIHAAQAMQARLPELNARWRKLGLGAPLQIRIGINTGMVSVGSYGSEGRMTYTAIGLQTNIAARLQSHCAPGGILISDATWQLVREEIACESRGDVECKGVHFPVAVYAPK